MKINKNLLVLIILLLFTAISAVIANSNLPHSKIYIILLSAIKFLLVGFYFMELRKAHFVWKLLFSGYIGCFVLLFLVF